MRIPLRARDDFNPFDSLKGTTHGKHQKFINQQARLRRIESARTGRGQPQGRRSVTRGRTNQQHTWTIASINFQSLIPSSSLHRTFKETIVQDRNLFYDLSDDLGFMPMAPTVRCGLEREHLRDVDVGRRRTSNPGKHDVSEVDHSSDDSVVNS
jgi:hypothetical protein